MIQIDEKSPQDHSDLKSDSTIVAHRAVVISLKKSQEPQSGIGHEARLLT